MFSLYITCEHCVLPDTSLLIIQECTCVLVCDDSEEVSSVAQEFFGYLFSSNREHLEHDVAAIFSRFIALLRNKLF